MEVIQKKLKTENNSISFPAKESPDHEKVIYIRFKDPEGSDIDEILQINVNAKAKELEEHLNLLLGNEEH